MLKKYSYYLKNLDCANCANKIQETLSKEADLENVVVNFSTLKLNFESESTNVETKVKQIISKIEPEVYVVTENKTSVDGKKSNIKFSICRLFIGIILSIIGCYVKLPWYFNDIITVIAYVILLCRTFKNAVKLIVKSKTINENFLITISCIGAYLVGQHMEGLMVIILYEIGKILEERAVNKSRASISELMNIKPEYANLKNGSEHKKVSPEEVKIGDIILIKQGEKIPLDGVVISGDAKLDMAALTGESAYVSKSKNDTVLSGSILISGMLEVEVTSEYENSTVRKILELVENATDKKAKTETFVAKAAKIYTPVVLILAIIVALFMPLVFSDITYSQSIYRALIFLVISCPCAIAISVPLSYFSGIGRASKEGILIKGSNYLDSLKDISKIVFDKTGTITTGKFEVSSITSNDEKIYSKDDILKYVAMAEKFSNHPIAKSILDKVNYTIDTSKVENFEEIAGKGLKYTFNGNEYKVGNFTQKERDESGTVIYLLENGVEIGSVTLRDGIKKDTKDAISKLNNMKIETLMYTGDNEKVASQVANEVGIEKYKSKMLPYDKYSELENMLNNKEKGEVIAFVGDGINDSPVLALSDVGISMGGVGQQAAIEASDVVIMTDSLDKIVSSIKISKKTVKIIKENLTFAIGVKVLVLVLSAIGIAGMWQAVFADVGVTLITILNTLRILRK